jgi:succinylglutamate desuccinylase
MTNKMTQKLFIGCCTHGDEQVGLAIVQKYPKGQTEFFDYQTIICNPKAVDINKRFVEQDLNRSFPGMKNGNYEQNRAFEITKLLERSDFIIDIHQTTAFNNSCIIVNKLSKLNGKMVEYINIENVIIDHLEGDEFEFSKATNEVGGLCLDSVFPEKSLTIEYSKLDNPKLEFEILEIDFNNFINQSKVYNHKKFYTFVGTLNKIDHQQENKLQNFVELMHEQKLQYNLDSNSQIYPCFIGEKAYDEVYCFWLKKVEIGLH